MFNQYLVLCASFSLFFCGLACLALLKTKQNIKTSQTQNSLSLTVQFQTHLTWSEPNLILLIAIHYVLHNPSEQQSAHWPYLLPFLHNSLKTFILITE